MSDNHTGLIVLTHAAIESNRSPSLQAGIRKIEDDHDHELDIILSMLRRIYKDGYVPGPLREYNLMAQSLRAGTGDSTTFFHWALKIEERALQIIDDYLPNAKNSQVRKIAVELRRDEPREIAALRKLLNQP